MSHSGTIFGPPEEEEKKAKKGVAVLSGTFSRKGFQGLLGQRRQALLNQKLLCLKRAGRELKFRGARHRWGTPGLYTHVVLTNCRDSQRNRGTTSQVPPNVAEHWE